MRRLGFAARQRGRAGPPCSSPWAIQGREAPALQPPEGYLTSSQSGRVSAPEGAVDGPIHRCREAPVVGVQSDEPAALVFVSVILSGARDYAKPHDCSVTTGGVTDAGKEQRHSSEYTLILSGSHRNSNRKAKPSKRFKYFRADAQLTLRIALGVANQRNKDVYIGIFDSNN